MAISEQADASGVTAAQPTASRADRVFWQRWLADCAVQLDARRAVLFGVVDDKWQALEHWQSADNPGAEDPALLMELVHAAAASSTPTANAAPVDRERAVAVPVPVDADSPRVLVLIPGALDPARTRLLSTLARLPALEGQHHEAARVRARMDRLFDITAFAIRLGEETRFMQAALLLCNELAARYDCDRVALGWLQGPYIRLKALSHVEQFDARMEAAQQLESVMEEAFDQDERVNWPADKDGGRVTRTHEQYARAQGVGHLLSVPLRVGDRPEAILTLERLARPFDADEAWEIDLVGQAVSSRMDVLQRTDRWFGARALAATKRFFGRLWGVEHSLAKLVGVLLAATVLVLIFVDWPYRVEGAFTLRGEDVRFVPAPFDGYLKSARVDIGDAVTKGQVVVELDRNELILEQAMVAADLHRYASEVDKARGLGKLADMRIAEAQRDQSEARLELVGKQLENASVRAPMDGIVVEGELKENLGAPLRKGDMLLKVAALERTYVDIEVDQADIHEISEGSGGEMAFVGRPDLYFPLTVERIDPVAQPMEGRNVFRVRARHTGPVPAWWRPGMGGTAKIDVEERPLIWILTHRSVRYLQRVLWL